MAGSIGPISCTFLRPLAGEPEPYKLRVDAWQRPGMSGEGVQVVASGPGTYRYEAIFYDLPASVFQWGLNIQALVGTVVQIIDDFGTVYDKMLIKRSTGLQRTTAWDGSQLLHRGRLTITGTVQ